MPSILSFEPGKAYACRNLDENARHRSSSGGIYPLLAGAVLRRGGVVYAVRYNSTDYHVEHCRVTEEAQLLPTIGTKYAASVPDGIFAEAAQDLKDGKEVFFVGTPCQCAGLLAYLTLKRISREHLLCMDFVCHGTPSGKIWQTYLSQAVPDQSQITGVNMRDKSAGWIEYSMRIDAGDASVLSSRRSNPYLRVFVGNLDLRASCHECPFKGIHRPTDLTLGDYWGVKRFAPASYDPDGISLLFVHSQAGAHEMDGIREKVRAEEAMLREAIESNLCITGSSKRPVKREKFLQMLREGVPFETAAERALHKSVLERAQNRVQKLVGGGKRRTAAGAKAVMSETPEQMTSRIADIKEATDQMAGRNTGMEKASENAAGAKKCTVPPVLYTRKEECSGCTACAQICPAGAIRLQEDEDGFVYPQIDAQKCVGCGSCIRVCPMRRPEGWQQRNPNV